jgi:hypothetical protein
LLGGHQRAEHASDRLGLRHVLRLTQRAIARGSTDAYRRLFG